MTPEQSDAAGNQQPTGLCKYEYRPLKIGEIRVIDLDPGDQNSPFLCSIRHVSLGSKESIQWHVKDIYSAAHDEGIEARPRYEAISYTWGSSDLTATALVDSKWCLPITDSLANALKYLRHNDRPRTIWADAICINQEDLTEKSYQVSIMAVIYKLADKILVWLGVGEGFDTFVFTWIERSRVHRDHKCHADADPKACPFREPPTLCSCCDTARAKHGSEPQQVARGLMFLLTRSWWTRLWVLQEAFDHRRVVLHSGTHQSTWLGLATASEETVSHFGLLVQKAFERFCADRKSADWSTERYLPFGQTSLGTGKLVNLRDNPKWMGSNSESSWRAVECLLDSLGRQCAHPLDRIYAMRFISGLQNVPILQPDYRLSPDTLYGAFTRHVMTITGSNDSASSAAMLLSLASVDLADPRGEFNDWPSWVPKLHVLAGISRNMRRDVSLEQTTSFGRVSVHPASSLAELALSGWIVGFVLEVVSQSKSSFLYPERYDTIKEFLSSYETHLVSILNPSQSGHDRSMTVKLQTALQLFISERSLPSDIRKEYVETIDTAFESSWTLGVLQLHGLCLATWVPSRSRPGDQVCLFSGLQSLYVLREKGADWNRFSLIGDCPVTSDTVYEVSRLDPEVSRITPGHLRAGSGLGKIITLV